MPFNNVTVRLTYRIVVKNNKTGNVAILMVGTEQARGLANNIEDTTAEAMKEMAQNMVLVILDKIASYIKGNTKKVSARINGITDVDTVLEVKGLLQNIVCVSEVIEK
jgi:hypothetical protein